LVQHAEAQAFVASSQQVPSGKQTPPLQSSSHEPLSGLWIPPPLPPLPALPPLAALLVVLEPPLPPRPPVNAFESPPAQAGTMMAGTDKRTARQTRRGSKRREVRRPSMA
jgi:hypothetical protein